MKCRGVVKHNIGAECKVVASSIFLFMQLIYLCSLVVCQIEWRRAVEISGGDKHGVGTKLVEQGGCR